MKQNNYGGQAVIEGVMMKGKDKMAVAVRKDEEEIVIKEKNLTFFGDKYSLLQLPFIRGVIALISSLVTGIESLSFSAGQVAEEEDEEIGVKEIILSIVIAFAFAILLFVALPAFIISLIQNYIETDVILNLVEGLIKISAFLTYVVFISRINDIKRVFQYHGAEHKVIHNYESSLPLSIKNARTFTTLHPRCGTNFIFIVIILSIFFFSFFGRPPLLQRILYHILLLPVIAGTSYEIIKLAGKKEANPLIKILSYPGLMLQKLTTNEPDDSMLEVAMVALNRVLPEEERGDLDV
ncbi:MAG: DUF1385 domain-containing protein [Halanaerobiaceae bacterium]